MDILKIYNYALQREYEGKKFFEENSKRMGSAAAAGAFRALAAEEEKHIKFIQSQIEAIDQGKAPDETMGVRLEKEGFFTQRAHDELLDQTIIEAMVPDLPVLRTAYLIERDFAEFYEMSAKKSAGAAKNILNMLSTWERGHEAFFKQLHDAAFEQYAQMPWGG